MMNKTARFVRFSGLISGLVVASISSNVHAIENHLASTNNVAQAENLYRKSLSTTSNRQTVFAGDTVMLLAKTFDLPKSIVRFQWQQISGPRIELINSETANAHFIAPTSSSGAAMNIEISLIATNKLGRSYEFTQSTHVQAPQPHVPPALVQQRNANEFLIPGSYHPLGDPLVAVIHFPQGASAENPVPGCAIVHGSGGLFKEVQPGQSCSQQVENTYQNLSDQLIVNGVATILPSSFYSRDQRFCEDNEDDYLAFGAAPFFNGNDPIARDDSYKIRRVAVRTMDMLATMKFFCDLDQVDCSKSCMVGTSNGATSIMAYTAQSLSKDILEFMDDDKRPFEYNSTRQKRNVAFTNFPPLAVSKITLANQLANRPLPKFAQLVSPGCTMRDLVPDIEPGNENIPFGLDELYYPANDTELTFEVGTNDNVPKECYTAAPNGDGYREIQARYFEQQSGIGVNDSRYIINIHQNGPHNLLADPSFSVDILNRLDDLLVDHFTP